MKRYLIEFNEDQMVQIMRFLASVRLAPNGGSHGFYHDMTATLKKADELLDHPDYRDLQYR